MPEPDAAAQQAREVYATIRREIVEHFGPHAGLRPGNVLDRFLLKYDRSTSLTALLDALREAEARGWRGAITLVHQQVTELGPRSTKADFVWVDTYNEAVADCERALREAAAALDAEARRREEEP